MRDIAFSRITKLFHLRNILGVYFLNSNKNFKTDVFEERLTTQFHSIEVTWEFSYLI